MATNDELISEMLHENARLARLKAAAGVSVYDKDTFEGRFGGGWPDCD